MTSVCSKRALGGCRLGRRVEINENGAITRYVYDGDNIHLEYDGSNQQLASYTDGLGTDVPLEMVRGGQAYYYVQDGMGSTTALTDASGNVVDSYTYDGFGRQTSTGSISNPFTYTGREYDPKSGLCYYRDRYYDPASGRFLSEDPVASLNTYPYASGNPVEYVDPTGAADTTEDVEITNIDNLVSEAKSAYRSKATRIELHHPIPKYLGGDPNQPLVPLNAAYH